MDVLTGQQQRCHKQKRQEILATLCHPVIYCSQCVASTAQQRGPTDSAACKQVTKDLANNPATSHFPTCEKVKTCGTETLCGSATFTVVQFMNNKTQMCNINLMSI